jgi:hypothetical protein
MIASNWLYLTHVDEINRRMKDGKLWNLEPGMLLVL